MKYSDVKVLFHFQDESKRPKTVCPQLMLNVSRIKTSDTPEAKSVCLNVTLTLLMTTLQAFQLRSLGIRPLGAKRTRTAAETFVTMTGGFGNVRNSVRFN